MAEKKEYRWVPTTEDYERIAARTPNDRVHKAGRAIMSRYTERAFGDPVILQTDGFKAFDKSKGNIILVPSHRNKLETVVSPEVFEQVGLHHARPSAKVELFQNPIQRRLLLALGAFPVARGAGDQAAYFAAMRAMLARGDILTLYGEGERKTSNVERVHDIKLGVVQAILESDSTVSPISAAGMSELRVGNGADAHTIARDHRSKHGDGPRLVYSFGDPFKLEPITINPSLPRQELTRTEFRDRADQMLDRAEIIQIAVQAEFDRAYLERGSMLEDQYPLAA